MKTNKAKGRMYPWCDRVANPLEGKCPHDCAYCYMKDLKQCSDRVRRKYSGPIRLSEKVMTKPWGKHGITRREDLSFVPNDVLVVFICSGHDLGTAPCDLKKKILKDCWSEPQNFYLLQSKNPAGLKEVEEYFPPNTIVGTTVETNRNELTSQFSNAPPPWERIKMLNEFKGYWKMVSGEPKMKCDPPAYVSMIREADPDFFSFGADRKGKHGLPESSRKVLLEVIREAGKFTEVFMKENLKRLLRENSEQNKDAVPMKIERPDSICFHEDEGR